MRPDIKTQIDITKESIKTSMDSLIMDSVTNTYNEVFLREYLTNYLTVLDHGNLDKNMILMVIHIDNIAELNIKYSSEKGNETIINLGYLIRQNQTEDDLLFKTKGPDYTLLVHDYQGLDIKDYAAKFQIAVRNAEIFFEHITISVAVVKLRELNRKLSVEEKVNQLLIKSMQRISNVHQLSDNAYIDKDNIINKNFMGRILLADSDQLALNIGKTFLSKYNYQVITATDGIEAVEIAKKRLFDIIIVDRYLLKQDGILVKQHLNDSSLNMKTMFILTVQYKDVSIIEKGNHLGIDFVIAKPIIYEEILGIISRNIQKRSSAV